MFGSEGGRVSAPGCPAAPCLLSERASNGLRQHNLPKPILVGEHISLWLPDMLWAPSPDEFHLGDTAWRWLLLCAAPASRAYHWREWGASPQSCIKQGQGPRKVIGLLEAGTKIQRHIKSFFAIITDLHIKPAIHSNKKVTLLITKMVNFVNRFCIENNLVD